MSANGWGPNSTTPEWRHSDTAVKAHFWHHDLYVERVVVRRRVCLVPSLMCNGVLFNWVGPSAELGVPKPTEITLHMSSIVDSDASAVRHTFILILAHQSLLALGIGQLDPFIGANP